MTSATSTEYWDLGDSLWDWDWSEDADCRMTSAPSTEYWGEEPPRLNLGQLLPLQTFRLVAKSNL